MALRKANARIMRSGLRGSGAGLVTASAGPTAPLAEAKLMSAPQVQTPRAPTATPAARAAQTDFAGQADGVNTARIMQNKRGDIVGGEFGFGNNVQKYDAKKLAWIMGRGASGGSLSTADRAVYDRMMYLRAQKTAQEQEEFDYQKALGRKNAEDDRKRKLDAQEWDRQNGVRLKQTMDAEDRAESLKIAEERRRNEEYDRRTKAAQDYKAQQEQAALDAENARYEALNKKHGIAEGTRLSEKDYNDLEAGRSKWGYSRTDQQAIDTINNDMDEARRNGKFTPEELAKAEEEAKAKFGGFQKRLLPNDQPQTAEQIYNSAIDAPDGTKLVSNGSGGLVAIPGTGPQKEVETPSEKNARLAQERKDKWLDDRITAIMKDGGGTDKDGNPISVPYNDAYDQAMKEMGVRFPSAPSTQTAQSSVAGVTPQPATPPATQTNDPRKKWAQFAD